MEFELNRNSQRSNRYNFYLLHASKQSMNSLALHKLAILCKVRAAGPPPKLATWRCCRPPCN